MNAKPDQGAPGPEEIGLPRQQPPAPESAQPSEIPFSVQINDERAQLENQRDLLLRNKRGIRIGRLEQLRHSTVVAYYSNDIIHDMDAQQFYDLLSSSEYQSIDHLDLILFGPGGNVDPAFKIARLCQQLTSKEGQKFSVLIPYYAKSALTILALGADEVVMGPLSELGPIDPQIWMPEEDDPGPYPLLGIQDAIDFIQERIKQQPEMALLFMPLMERIGLLSLGSYEREIKSSKQYATELLSTRMLKGDSKKSAEIAEELTSHYKRHAHVIDRKEARRLGLTVLDAPSDEWSLLWQLHKLYEDYLKDPAQVARSIVTIIETKTATFKRPLLRRRQTESSGRI